MGTFCLFLDYLITPYNKSVLNKSTVDYRVIKDDESEDEFIDLNEKEMTRKLGIIFYC